DVFRSIAENHRAIVGLHDGEMRHYRALCRYGAVSATVRLDSGRARNEAGSRSFPQGSARRWGLDSTSDWSREGVVRSGPFPFRGIGRATARRPGTPA